MRRKNNNSRIDFFEIAYSATNSYYGTGRISEDGTWMSGEENTSYYESYCCKIYKDVNSRASSMRV